MNNQKFHHRHAPHLFTLVVLLCISAVSGYIGFFSHAPQGYASTPQTISQTSDEHGSVEEKNGDKKRVAGTKNQKAAAPPTTTNQNEEKSDDIKQTISVELRVENNLFPRTIAEGKTAYDLMNILVEDEQFTFGGKDFGSGLGFFVEEINGKKEDRTNRWYWVYSINGEKAKTGISSYILQEGDIISWTYEQEHS